MARTSSKQSQTKKSTTQAKTTVFRKPWFWITVSAVALLTVMITTVVVLVAINSSKDENAKRQQELSRHYPGFKFSDDAEVLECQMDRLEKGLTFNREEALYHYEALAERCGNPAVDDCSTDPSACILMKPILYLYPTKTTDVSVEMQYPEYIDVDYPEYSGGSGWHVTAHPNGDLYDTNGKYYYALYWDETNSTVVDFSTGFYVTKDQAAKFLEDKLSAIGLNDRESNEFIMYWLPKLEHNGQSLVYFELTDERQAHNALKITPKPDSLLRINIHIKKVSQPTHITPQTTPHFERHGFTAVEWGGTEH